MTSLYGSFATSPSPSPFLGASEVEDADDGSGDDANDDEDEDASSSDDEEMTASQ